MVSLGNMVDGVLKSPGFIMHALNFPTPADVDRLFHSTDYVLAHRCVSPGSDARGCMERNDGAKPQWADVGQLLFVPSGFPLRFQANAIKEKQISSFSISKARFEEFAHSKVNWRADDLGAYLQVHNFRIVEVMRRLRDEAITPDFGSWILCESLGQTLIVELFRHFRQRPSTEEKGFAVDQVVVRTIEDYVRAMCGEGAPPTIGDLAELCKVSPRHLTKNFKRTTGHTVHEFVETVRLAHASDLLSNTCLPIKIIAWRTGFRTASRFAASFKRGKGMTPRRFRSALGDNGRSAVE